MVNFKLFFYLVAFFTLVLDQVSKFLILHYQPNWSVGFIDIIFLKNSGAGFGILQGWSLLLGVVSLLVAGAVVYYYDQVPKQTWPQLFLGFFLGGVVGNAVDRLLRSYVVDFIDLGFWPAFNIADAAITIGAIGLIIVLWKK